MATATELKPMTLEGTDPERVAQIVRKVRERVQLFQSGQWSEMPPDGKGWKSTFVEALADAIEDGGKIDDMVEVGIKFASAVIVLVAYQEAKCQRDHAGALP